MDGYVRMSLLTQGDRRASARRDAEEAFRAWHRRPDAEPDPLSPAFEGNRRWRGLRRLVVRLVAP